MEKEYFKRYVAIQYSGMYNMITEANSVWELANMPQKEYWAIQDNYSELVKKYPDVYEEAKKIGQDMAKKIFGE